MRYLLQRVAILLITGWAALTINFLIPRLMPGNPVETMIAKFQGRISTTAIHALELQFGLHSHQGWWLQYLDYWRNILTGHLGVSVTYYPQSVGSVLAQSVPWTVGLVGLSTVIAFLAGTLIGIRSAWRRGRLGADLSVPVALFLNSTPYFWFALILLYAFAFLLSWFPLSGGAASSGSPQGLAYLGSLAYHGTLPLLTLVITSLGGWLLTMRNNMLSTVSEDYVAFAQARGLPEGQVMYRYAARNAILPSFTAFAMAIGFVISGTLLTEIVFSYPGVGFILYQAVTSLDYPLMQAIFLFISLAVLAANFIADLVYILVDPRAREGR
jgi:peptide/nickel transport system permease protein